jgi:hypothetical protein
MSDKSFDPRRTKVPKVARNHRDATPYLSLRMVCTPYFYTIPGLTSFRPREWCGDYRAVSLGRSFPRTFHLRSKCASTVLISPRLHRELVDTVHDSPTTLSWIGQTSRSPIGLEGFEPSILSPAGCRLRAVAWTKLAITVLTDRPGRIRTCVSSPPRGYWGLSPVC